MRGRTSVADPCEPDDTVTDQPRPASIGARAPWDPRLNRRQLLGWVATDAFTINQIWRMDALPPQILDEDASGA